MVNSMDSQTCNGHFVGSGICVKLRTCRISKSQSLGKLLNGKGSQCDSGKDAIVQSMDGEFISC